jgi:hypothetical protein
MKRSLIISMASTIVATSILLPSIAQAETTSSAATKQPKKTVDIACMATAVTTRDTAISTALNVVVTALQSRGQALSAAWSITDVTARQTAIKAANTAFAGTWKTFNTARNTAWNQYRTAAKACRSTTVESPSATSGSM